MTPPTRLRVVFLGTPEFAVPSLIALHAEAEVLAVVTQPDRPKGRGRLVASPAVVPAARALSLHVLQPARLRDPALLQTLAALRPDLIVTVAYGKIVPSGMLALPLLGCINLHPSLLPRYRGASPIQAAIAAGEPDTGVTIMYQSPDLDAGDIILQRRTPIGPDDTAATLEDRLAHLGAEVLVEAVRLVARGTAPRRPQDPGQATYVGKLTKDDGRIDWDRPAEAVSRLIRAMDPWPSAYTRHRGRLLKIWAGTAADGPVAEPGTVVAIRQGEGFAVAAGRGALLVREVQPEGGRRMSADEYVRGQRLRVGERFGDGPTGGDPQV